MPLSSGGKRIINEDNISGHFSTDEVLAAAASVNTEVHYFPNNATAIIQLSNSFGIQKIKSTCSTRWETHKMKSIIENRGRDSSVKPVNPRGHLFCVFPPNL